MLTQCLEMKARGCCMHVFLVDVYMRAGWKILRTVLSQPHPAYPQTGMNPERNKCKHKYISDRSQACALCFDKAWGNNDRHAIKRYVILVTVSCEHAKKKICDFGHGLM